jgi:hypothetical protein
MPAEGFPLLFYVNGIGGRSRRVLDRGKPGAGPRTLYRILQFERSAK